MLFVNFKRIFLTLIFIAGAGTLLFGYSGLAGMFFRETAGAQKAVDSAYQARSGGVEIRPDSEIATEREAPDRDGFFVDCRMQREKARGQQIELLKEIVNNPSTAADLRQAAQEQLLGISRSVAREARLENLLKAKGYRDAVVSMDIKGVTVVLDSRGLNPSEESRIIELVSRETGLGEQGIIVMPKI